jgi:hypothetical protein
LCQAKKLDPRGSKDILLARLQEAAKENES